METTLRLYQIARNGEIIGAYTLEELVICLDEGRVTLEDHYLVEGMQEWRLVRTLGMALEEARNDLKDKERKAKAQAMLAQNQHKKYVANWMGSLTPPQGAEPSPQGPAAKPAATKRTPSNYPEPSGLKRGVMYILGSGLAGILTLTITAFILIGTGFVLALPLLILISLPLALVTIALAAVGAANLNSFSIERALQRFDKYRER